MRTWGVTADSSVLLQPSSAAGFRAPPIDCKLLASPFCHPDSRAHFSAKAFASIGWPKFGIPLENHRTRSLKARALGNSNDDQTPIAPLQFESATGQLLSQIMQTHPHLLPAAIDQQLESLQTDLAAEKANTPVSTQDLLLYRRIAEVKEKERQKRLEEIVYCLIVQKFMENKITMIPTIPTPPDPTFQVDSWPNQEHKLESIHSPDALEMIQSHLTLILGERVIGPLNTIVQISKLKLGKLYAASIMYGYFLKRVDERYQLERSMNTLPTRTKGQRVFDELKPNPLWDLESMVQISSDDDDFDNGEESDSYRLRSYVMYLDAETLQRYATIRSKESISLIEKQTQALFGKPDIRIAEDGSLEAPTDEVVAITFSGLSMLVLEAVAFGTFLWEAEGYVESKYHFLSS
ncbi:UV-B-induced protein, chloroplastic [Canna indica]|uniref:UV-B-induced protein, chloroplastic n=1 Tax=Canna indica TaxID=4628 RepID=A0AAQ3KP34_9LILI|nr:UV-B-induced protein, chloroplastic [Canna indica]